MEIIIKGVKYKVTLETKKEYIKKHTDGSYAHLDKLTKTLAFRTDHISKKIIMHEVMHAYINACHLASCNDISMDDFEEIVCELVEEHHSDIGKTTNQIYKYLKEV